MQGSPMKIIEISESVDTQMITLSEDASDFIILEMLRFDGSPKKDMWQSDCGFYLIDEDCQRSTFLGFVNGSFGCDFGEIPSEVIKAMERDGEFLDIAIDQLGCYNATLVIDCVDRGKTTWAPVVGGGEPYWLKKAAFDPRKVPKNRMFHLPKWTSKIYYVLDQDDESYADSFYRLYHEVGLTGLEFKEASSASFS
jgi:hypothetical protein